MPLSAKQRAAILMEVPDEYIKPYTEGKITDDQLEAYGRDIGILGADFSNVKGERRDIGVAKPKKPRAIDGTPLAGVVDDLEESGDNFVSTLGSALAGNKRSLAGALYTAADNQGSYPAAVVSGLANQFGALSDLSKGDLGGLIKRTTDSEGALKEDLVDLTRGSVESAANVKRGLDQMSPGGRWVSEPIMDVAGSLSSLGSLPGGAFAAVPAADVYGQTYMTARQQGATKEEAATMASTDMAIEGGVSALPAGKVLGKLIPGLDKWAAKSVRTMLPKAGIRTGVTATGEALEEGLTEAIQIDADSAFRAYGTDKQQEIATAQRPVNVWNQISRAAKAGFVGGAGFSAPGATFQAYADAGKMVTDLNKRDLEHASTFRKPKPTTEVNPSALNLPSVAEQAATLDIPGDFQKAQEQLELRKADQQEAEFRNNELGLYKAREFAEANPDNVMAQALSKPLITPEDVASERELNKSTEQRAAEAKALSDAKMAEDARLAPFRKEAEKAAKKADTSILAKAKSQYGAERRKVMGSLNTQFGNLPAPERIEAVARGIADWSDANPLPTMESVRPAPQPQPAAPGVTPVTPTAAAPVTPASPSPAQGDLGALRAQYRAADPRATDAEIDAMVTADTTPAAGTEEALRKQFTGLASTQGGEATGAKAADVVNSIRSKIGRSKDANILAKMVADDKLAIVDSADQIPGDDVPPNARGYYDGTRMYIVADQVDPNNLRGSLLVVGAHEADHAARVSGNAEVKKAMGGWLAGDSVSRINDKVRKAAQSGDTTAQSVVDAVDALPISDADKALEMPAYFINASQGVAAGSGFLGNIKREIVASVRTKYKTMTGNDDVNLQDVEYLSRKLTEAVAETSGSIKGDNAGLALAVGPQSSKFEERRAAGLTYIDRDGKEKTLLSDEDSKLKRKAFEYGADLMRGGTVQVRDLIDNANLEDYPTILDASAILDLSLKEGAAWFTGDDGSSELRLSQQVLDTIDFDPGSVHDIILHEVQHGVQEIEDFARGGSPVQFRTEEDKALVTKHNSTIKEHNRLAAAVTTSDLDVSRTSKNELKAARQSYQKGTISASEFANDVASILEQDENGDRYAKTVAEEVRTTFSQYASEKEAIKEMAARTLAQYLELHGEAESNFAQDNRLTTQAELDKKVSPGYKTKTVVTGQRTPPATGLAMTGDLYASVREALLGGKPGRKEAKGVNTVLGQASGFGVLGRELSNIHSFSEGEASAVAFSAEVHYGKIGFGIRTMADTLQKANPGMTYKTAVSKVSKDVSDTLSGFAKLQSAKSRESALARYILANPELRPLMNAMVDMNNKTDELIALRMKDPTPLTEEELTRYTYMANNKFNYLTRTFAAFAGKQGKSRSEKIRDEYFKGKAQIAKGEGVSSRYKKSFDLYSRGVRFVIDNDIGVFDIEHLAHLELDKLEFMYSQHIGPPETLRKQIKDKEGKVTPDMFRDQAVLQLSEFPKTTGYSESKIEAKAEQLVEGMLGLNGTSGPIVEYYRNLSADMSILKTKTVLPQELLDLFGDIDDIPTKIAITLAKQGELVARLRMLAEIADGGEGHWYIKPTSVGDPGTTEFTELLKGEAWGPLEGMYVNPTISSAITDGLDMYTSLGNALNQSFTTVDRALEHAGNKLVNTVKKASSMHKYATIVISGMATVWNSLGSVYQATTLTVLGITNPQDLARAARVSLNLISNVITPAGVVGRKGPGIADPDTLEVLEMGLADSAIGQQLRATPTKFFHKLISDTEGVTTLQEWHNRWQDTRRVAGSIKDAGTEVFSLSDAWIKPAVYFARKRHLYKYYKATGETRTEKQIRREAADHTLDISVSFQRAAPIVKFAERGGVALFGPYIQTVFRSVAYSYINGAKDIVKSFSAPTKEAQLIQGIQGVQKLTAALALTYGASMASVMLADFANSTDDEKERKWLGGAKKLLRTELRYGGSVYMGKDDKGMPTFLNLGRADQNGPATDLMRIILSKETPEHKLASFKEALYSLWIQPGTTSGLLQLGFAMSTEADGMLKNKNTKTERVFPKTALAFKDLARAWGAEYDTAETTIEVLDKFFLALFNGFDEDNNAPVEPKDEATAMVARAVIVLGGKIEAANPSMAAFLAGSEFNKMRKVMRKDIAETLSVSGPEAALEKYLDLVKQDQDNMKQVQLVYDGMIEMGTSPAKALAILKDEGSMEAQDLALIRQGRVNASLSEWSKEYSNLFSEKSIETTGEFANRKLTDAEAKEADKKRKEVVKKFKVLKGDS